MLTPETDNYDANQAAKRTLGRFVRNHPLLLAPLLAIDGNLAMTSILAHDIPTSIIEFIVFFGGIALILQSKEENNEEKSGLDLVAEKYGATLPAFVDNLSRYLIGKYHLTDEKLGMFDVKHEEYFTACFGKELLGAEAKLLPIFSAEEKLSPDIMPPLFTEMIKVNNKKEDAYEEKATMLGKNIDDQTKKYIQECARRLADAIGIQSKDVSLPFVSLYHLHNVYESLFSSYISDDKIAENLHASFLHVINRLLPLTIGMLISIRPPKSEH